MNVKMIILVSLMLFAALVAGIAMAWEGDCRCCDIGTLCYTDGGIPGTCHDSSPNDYYILTNDTSDWVRDIPVAGHASYESNEVCCTIKVFESNQQNPCSGRYLGRHTKEGYYCYKTCSTACLHE